MTQVHDSPQSKRFDEAGRPIRYSVSVRFTDAAGADWLRHEYIRWDEKLAIGKPLSIVMEFEKLTPRK